MATTEEDVLRGQIADLEDEVDSLQTQLEGAGTEKQRLLDVIAAAETEVDSAIDGLQTVSRDLYQARK